MAQVRSVEMARCVVSPCGQYSTDAVTEVQNIQTLPSDCESQRKPGQAMTKEMSMFFTATQGASKLTSNLTGT